MEIQLAHCCGINSQALSLFKIASRPSLGRNSLMAQWMLGFLWNRTPKPEPSLGCIHGFRLRFPSHQAGEQNRIESSVTRCSWLICGIILCKNSSQGVGLAVAEAWALWTGGAPLCCLCALLPSGLVSCFVHLVKAHSMNRVSSPKMKIFICLFFFSILVMPKQSAHHCVVEVENFLFVLGGEDQWNLMVTIEPLEVMMLSIMWWEALVKAIHLIPWKTYFCAAGTNEVVGDGGWQLEGGSTVELARRTVPQQCVHSWTVRGFGPPWRQPLSLSIPWGMPPA